MLPTPEARALPYMANHTLQFQRASFHRLNVSSQSVIALTNITSKKVKFDFVVIVLYMD